MPNGVELEGRLAHVGTFPIGIEPGSFTSVCSRCFFQLHPTSSDPYKNLQKQPVGARIAQLEQRFHGVKVIVGVDRLDYIKGVPQKLHALELFLSQHPEWIGKVFVNHFRKFVLVIDRYTRSFLFNWLCPHGRMLKSIKTCGPPSTNLLDGSMAGLALLILCPSTSCTRA